MRQQHHQRHPGIRLIGVRVVVEDRHRLVRILLHRRRRKHPTLPVHPQNHQSGRWRRLARALRVRLLHRALQRHGARLHRRRPGHHLLPARRRSRRKRHGQCLRLVRHLQRALVYDENPCAVTSIWYFARRYPQLRAPVLIRDQPIPRGAPRRHANLRPCDSRPRRIRHHHRHRRVSRRLPQSRRPSAQQNR